MAHPTLSYNAEQKTTVSILDDGMNMYAHQLEERPQISEPKNTNIPLEIDAYFNEKLSPPEVEPLAYWKNHTHFPILSMMARDYVAIQATSASSERTFSRAKHVITETRTRLGSHPIESLMCLRSWQNFFPE